ncbi:hypothetical protein BDN72DRAFT_896853 [Pluteus cervinus]|uniref:Uncharacterized protein n=1 Tax=Pluteus cervinus TaxID=181527 RepID=A0ACD3AVD5_9AGAR|nr:hypothetical protein BDN72DRAFT_896853 [Pluteus cervinus]
MSLKLLDIAHEVAILMGMYRFLITDYLNPLALGNTKNSGGAFYIHMGAIFGTILIALVQLFFAWRLWAFSVTISKRLRWTLALLTVSLALLTFAAGIVISVRTEPSLHSGPSVFTPTGTDASDWKLQLPSAIACDVVITFGMVINLYRSRTGIRRTNEVLNLLIMFTVNTGLLTVILSTASLICFFVLPTSVLAYVALELIIPHCYINSLLAILNSREYLHEKMSTEIPISIGDLKFASDSSGTRVHSAGPDRIESTNARSDSIVMQTTVFYPSGQTEEKSPQLSPETA